jgi:hypothetical protein
MATKREGSASSENDDCFDVVESPDGVLNVIIRRVSSKPGGVEALRHTIRRGPKRAH